MKHLKFLFFSLFALQLSFSPLRAQKDKTPGLDPQMVGQLTEIHETDQRYRTYLAYGTTDDAMVAEIKAQTKDMEIEEYLSYTKGLDLKLSKKVQDSLWILQHKADANNHRRIVALIETHGYPDNKRLGLEHDIFPILLHPPVNLEPRDYLKEMSALLKKEVKAERMPAKLYATFYDNILCKILDEPQLYGTNVPFSMKTMSVGLPEIQNINRTNRARRKLGMKQLAEGEYKISEKPS